MYQQYIQLFIYIYTYSLPVYTQENNSVVQFLSLHVAFIPALFPLSWGGFIARLWRLVQLVWLGGGKMP